MKRLQVFILTISLLAICAGAGFSLPEEVNITYGERVDFGRHPGYLYFRFAPEPYPPAASRQAHIYHYKDSISGESGFCLHPNRLSAQGEMVRSEFYSYFPTEDLQRLELAVAIGFHDHVEGFEDNNLRYMFTQRYIWETIPVKYYGNNPDYIDAMGPAIITWRFFDGGTNRVLNQMYADWKSLVEQKIDESLILPSFSEQNIVLKKGEEVILEDAEHRLMDYTLESAPEGIDVSIEGQSLIISANQYAKSGKVILKHRSFERGVSFVYKHNDQQIQDLGIFKVSTPLEVELEVEVEKDPILSKIQVIKIDSTTKENIAQAGARFSLFHEETGGEPIAVETASSPESPMTEFMTDVSGMATFPQKLPEGIYWLEEIEGPKGYFLDPQRKRIEVKVESENTLVYVENVAQTGVLEIEKRGLQFVGWKSEVQHGYTVTQPDFQEAYLEGVKYVLERDGKIVCELVTGSVPARVEGLELGSYTLREIESPKGYVREKEVYQIEFTPQEPEETIHLIKKSFINSRQRGSFVIQKEMESSFLQEERAWEDVLFGLYNKHELMDMPVGTLMGVSTINKNGEGHFDVLVEGEYYLKELKTHPAYILSAEEYPVAFFLSEDEAEEEITEVDVGTNRLKKNNLRVVKRCKNTEIPLSGARFIVEAEDGTDRVSFGEMTTDVRGECNWELPHGKYFVKELESPVGYQSSSHECEIVIDGDHEVVIEWENEPNELIIIKIDEETQKPLQAGFQIFNDDGALEFRFTEGVYRPESEGESILRSDENGKITVLALPSGDYRLKEVNPPPGYEKAENVDFSFLHSLELIVKNERLPSLPDTGDRTEYTLRGASILILSGVLIYLYKSKSVRW
ncbi:MAG: hypothetical protein GX260_01600 [Tissierellia bacterium]|nr:hypothetical protein [Tissierellia bacterium]